MPISPKQRKRAEELFKKMGPAPRTVKPSHRSHASFYTTLYCTILKFIKPSQRKGKTVLELGSGPGFLLQALRKLGMQTTGLDLHEPNKKPKGITFQQGNIVRAHQIFNNKKFDIVVVSNVSSLRRGSFPVKFDQLVEKGGLVFWQEYLLRPQDLETLKKTGL